MKKEIRVVELFAGVGGFRLAFERYNNKNNIDFFKVIWANQWEPGKQKQYAFDCYESHFGKTKNHVNVDITKCHDLIPKRIDLLVGGFPCQDYSVAATNAKGIEGKKGVLWWEISKIINEKKPKYVLLENVDRLLKSPVKQRGRDFAIMLKDFSLAGYNVEWRVINAADYGFPQRRKRVFVFAWKKTNKILSFNDKNLEEHFVNNSFFSNEFKIRKEGIEIDKINLSKWSSILDVSNNFNLNRSFKEMGIMYNETIYQSKYYAKYEKKPTLLKNIILKDPFDLNLTLSNEQLDKMKKLKDAKKINRQKPNGEPYIYSEGKMNLIDDLDKTSRTMLTSESSINRSTHLIKDYITNDIRFLHPVECERLNGFDDNWTNTGMPLKMRYFCMGNALVVGLIEKMVKTIAVLEQKNKNILVNSDLIIFNSKFT